MFKNTAILFFFILSLQTALAQFGFKYFPETRVKINGDSLSNAWAGGLNYAQFSELDFNRDGMMDLLIFDRSSNQIQVFLKKIDNNNSFFYQYQYNAENKFPNNLRYRLSTADYDQDGDMDLFTYGIGGVRVYTNTSVGSTLNFELFKSELQSIYQGGPSTLFVSSSDIPAIVDVDSDGDVDILTFSNSGGTVEYHKNLSVENYGIPDSLEFEMYNQCWGKFEEGSSDNTITLNSNNPPCNGSTWISNPQKANRHSGSTVLALDIDNSGVLDLVLGDVSHENLVLLINGGTGVNQNSAMVSEDAAFPSNTTPAQLQIFPAAYYLDVNHDNVKDLVVGANAKGSSQNKESVLFYENLGSNVQPNFIYKSNAFMQRDMIDNGVGAHPVLVDLNGDGLEDLIVANFYRYKDFLDKESAMLYFQNTGSSVNPEFTLVTEDWNNFAASSFGLRIHPTFGDIDNDGDVDMFIGSELGNVHYYENMGSSTNPNFTNLQANITDNNGNLIAEDTYISPQLYDLNKDNLLDLIIGKKDGSIAYYQNTGDQSNFEFTKINNTLGNVSVAFGTSDGFATPRFFNHNDTTYLFCGSRSGQFWVYDDIDDHLSPGDSFNLISDNYLNINAKAYSSPLVGNIDNDAFYDLLYGHDLGGIWHFEADPNITFNVDEVQETNFKLFPNPNTGNFTLKGNFSSNNKLSLYDLKGNLVYEESNVTPSEIINLQVEKGIYILHLFDKEKSNQLTEKMIVR